MKKKLVLSIALVVMMVAALFGRSVSKAPTSTGTAYKTSAAEVCGSIIITESESVSFTLDDVKFETGATSAYVMVPYTKIVSDRSEAFLKVYDCAKRKLWDLGTWVATPEFGVVKNTHPCNVGCSKEIQAVTWYAYGQQAADGSKKMCSCDGPVLIVDGIVYNLGTDVDPGGSLEDKFDTSDSGNSWWLKLGTGETGYLIVNGRPYENVVLDEKRIIHKVRKVSSDTYKEYLCFLQLVKKGDTEKKTLSMRQIAVQ